MGEAICFTLCLGLVFRRSEQKGLREAAHAFNQLKKVFYQHQIDNIKNGMEIESTMPIGSSEAAVLCFDIIDSSKIDTNSANNFVEKSIKRCVSALTESYKAESMQASGYRIKEVGDGFLCSVGYPFPTLDAAPPAEAAIELAHELVDRFSQESAQLTHHHPVYCAVGIASGQIEGRFPQIGAIEYDVYGRAVTLATRYEKIRRVLWPEGLQTNVIIIQSQVFEALSIHSQSLFREFDLKSAGIKVRDDEDAGRLYYRFVLNEIPESKKLLTP